MLRVEQTWTSIRLTLDGGRSFSASEMAVIQSVSEAVHEVRWEYRTESKTPSTGQEFNHRGVTMLRFSLVMGKCPQQWVGTTTRNRSVRRMAHSRWSGWDDRRRSAGRPVRGAPQAAVAAAGPTAVLTALSRLARGRAPDDILTIVANEGVHHLPEEYRRGTVFVASRGSLDFSTPESIRDEFEDVLRDTARVLKSHDWRRVYLVPFGPTTLSMQLKLLVYRSLVSSL